MPVNFRSHRQGAAHIIERTDLVLVTETPIFRSGVGTFDTRICVRSSGFSERALWFQYPKHMDAPGASTEFHLWSYHLEESDVGRIHQLLSEVAREFAGFAPELDGQDCVTTLSFWKNGIRFNALLHQPGDLREQYSEAQVSSFVNAYNLIAEVVPQSPLLIDPHQP